MLYIILFQHSRQHLRLVSCSRPMLSTTHIKIQIDQLDPIIHFCSGGSIVTKHKWPSSCLMSMIIISAICQGFSKHLLWTQRWTWAANTVCRWQTIIIDILFIHYLLLYPSLFVPILIILILAIPSATATPGSFSSPQPPPLSRSLDYVEPESGKSVTMETGAEAVEGSLWEREIERERGEPKGERKREKDWELASVEESMSGHLTQVWLKEKAVDKFILSSVVEMHSWVVLSKVPYWTISPSLYSFCIRQSTLLALSFQWDSGEAMSDAPDMISACTKHEQQPFDIEFEPRTIPKLYELSEIFKNASLSTVHHFLCDWYHFKGNEWIYIICTQLSNTGPSSECTEELRRLFNLN